jgi:hypothetical protein
MSRLSDQPVNSLSVSQRLYEALSAKPHTSTDGIRSVQQAGRGSSRLSPSENGSHIDSPHHVGAPQSGEAHGLEPRATGRLWLRPTIFGLLMAVVLSVGYAFLAVGIPMAVRISRVNHADDPGASSAFSVGQIQSAVQSVDSIKTEHANKAEHAKLFVEPATAHHRGEAVPLGVSVRGSDEPGLALVRGFASGAKLSTGTRLNDNNWWLSLTELRNAVIQPPPDFVGAMDVIVELRLANTTLDDRQSLHFEWNEALVPEARTSRPVAHHLAAEEIGALLKRGDELIASGDLAAARLVLRRAAEAGDARAALKLAGTYDPAILDLLKVHGFAADAATARHWYEIANELGSPDAPRRLAVLANSRD